MQNELKFDLVSPVDELAKQIRMEFDFKHEALVMNEVGKSLQVHISLSLICPCTLLCNVLSTAMQCTVLHAELGQELRFLALLSCLSAA